ncbi:MAG: Sec-independent protein secretion pathway component [Actinobacteria bacterium]|jgi:sec-independent protein translocase protein TatB|nr:Sec-independent protein secretion pathway component [Actinomycetota bacterium]NCW34597.1 Sec-independent protein secretion pathway component [Actinomycetota bacterium]NCZ73790.1 Sec-independent protein secretion pathway component [Actinomycetota bacterium]NDC12728.1 Sec-independent protein secretion pathway component [Actinomycetota bacterium]NDF42122.1 Sec-independent protein secretion pathway component [Actinomycetota bacterium]
MFGIGMGEFLGLVVLGLFLVGPERLPTAARDFARILHKVRNFTSYATRELKENLGPGFENLDVKDLNPKNLAKKVINDALEDTKPVVNEVKRQTNEIKNVAKIDPDLL